MFKVVKPFAFSLDGFTRVDLEIGDAREDFGSHNDGLVAEGYIEAAVEQAPAPEPVAPAADPVVEPVSAPPQEARRRRGK